MAGTDTTRVDTNRMDAAVSAGKIAATEHSGSQTDNDRNWLERIPAAYWILGLLFLIMFILLNKQIKTNSKAFKLVCVVFHI